MFESEEIIRKLKQIPFEEMNSILKNSRKSGMIGLLNENGWSSDEFFRVAYNRWDIILIK